MFWTLKSVRIDLIAPLCPSGHSESGKKLQVRSRTAPLHNLVDFVRFFGMFLLATCDDVDLATARRQRPQFTLYAKEHQFGHVSEIETDSAAIRPAVFSRLVPDD